jgi:hypothetical protein
MLKRCITPLVVLIALLVFVGLSYAKEADKSQGQGIAKPTTNDAQNWFTINNLFNWYINNGNSSYNPVTSNSGLEYPKGSEQQPIFEDGVVWGGFHKGRANPKVGGSVYRYGLQAGRIVTEGTATTDPVADSPDLAKYRVYKVRPDVGPTTSYAAVQEAMEAEAELINRYQAMTGAKLFAAYQKDWTEWPAVDGLPAPYTDVNKNGKYDPSVDIPGQPGADQTLYYVANDMSTTRASNLAGCPPIGLEMHRTVWGYNLGGALGNAIFASTLIINKSGASLDSAFFVQWSDPDLGDASDDFAGCDVSRSLGFIYNGSAVDGVYGKECPAAGYDFFQGPVVKGAATDSALFRLKYRKGYKNLGMTAFVFFINSNATYTDPAQGTNGDIQWYRLMNATTAPAGTPFTNPKTGQITKYTLDGDPVTGQGWLDGTGGFTPGDRRICLVTGPFTLAFRDTQELVTATLVGRGSDRISSVAVLKYYSDLAQYTYNNLFAVPRPPASPKVDIAALDGQIILSWETANGSASIEKFASVGYAFEGYNVYQFPGNNADVSTGKLLATYDVVNSITTVFDDSYDAASGYVLNKPVQFGTDFGLKRSYTTKADMFASGAPMHNGSTYYFGVTSYSVNPANNAKPKQLESVPSLLTIIPQQSVPGSQLNTADGHAITLKHSAGIASASAQATVIDPSRVIDRDYEIRVIVEDSVYHTDLKKMVANPRWVAYDANTGKQASNPSTDWSFSDANKIIDGVQVGISASPFYIAGHELGSLTYSPSANFNFSGVNSTPYAGNGFINSSLGPEKVATDVQIVFTAAGAGQKAYDFVRTSSSGSGGAPYEGFYDQPFKVYELNADGTQKRQIDFAFMEDNTRGAIYNKIWAPTTNSSDREYWFFIAEDYTATAKSKYTTGVTLNTVLAASPCVWSGWYILKDGTKPAYNVGDVWTIKTSKVVTTEDRWTYSTKGLGSTSNNANLAKVEVDRVNVYPNPYIGFNPMEANKYERFVTFTHLPTNATIRIFNLAGVLVRTMVKSDATQYFQWDLRNENGFPVGAGMYIAHVDMPDQGKTKILKLGVIPEQQFLDRW